MAGSGTSAVFSSLSAIGLVQPLAAIVTVCFAAVAAEDVVPVISQSVPRPVI
jgi:hypothetical protein